MYNKLIKKTIVASIAIIIFNGCISKRVQTQEEIEYNREMKAIVFQNIQKKINQYKGNQTNNKEIDKKNYITNKELIEQMESFPTIEQKVKFSKYKDGFTINNGERYIDTDGEIINYGYNWKNGNVTYMVKVAPNKYKVKFTRVLTEKEPIQIATIFQNRDYLNITTITGKKFNSRNIILTSKGFITIKNNSAFIYEIGKKVDTFITPKGWHIAKFQNGDVASTKYLLLEKTIDKSNSFLGLVDSSKSILSTFGIIDKKDYMLINIKDPKKKHALDIDVSGKNVENYSDCQKANKYVARCNHVEFKESLYSKTGLPNTAHYYWRILWFSTKDGALSVSRESTQTKVMLTNLNNGKRAEAAFRLTGFPELIAEQNKNGKIKVTAGGGLFPDKIIEDAEKFLDTAVNN